MADQDVARPTGPSKLFRLVPGLRTVRSYRREWLAKDIVAGIVLTTLLVPQGMAYAELAGLPPITGWPGSAISSNGGICPWRCATAGAA
jgi:Sulfate permease family